MFFELNGKVWMIVDFDFLVLKFMLSCKIELVYKNNIIIIIISIINGSYFNFLRKDRFFSWWFRDFDIFYVLCLK